MQPQNAPVKIRPQIMLIVWGAFLITILTFQLATYLASRQNPVPPADPFSHPLIPGIVLVALLNLALSHFVPKFMSKQGQPDIQRAFVIFILRCVLIETVAIFGVVGAFVTHTPNFGYLLGAIAFIAMVMAKPELKKTYTTTSSSIR